MVTGVDRFRDHFAGHEHQYVLIGGAACELIMNEAAIIPFKARAWLELSRQRDEGNKIDDKNIRKHRSDVARLLQLESASAQYALPDPVADDMRLFIEQAMSEADFDPKQFKVNMSREDVADRLRAAYQL